MSTYHIWKVWPKESWSDSIEATSVDAALAKSVDEDFDRSDDLFVYSSGDIVAVACKDGGHGKFKMFKLDLPEADHRTPFIKVFRP